MAYVIKGDAHVKKDLSIGRALDLLDDGGTNAVSLQSPSSTDDYVLTLPDAAPANNQVMVFDSSGNAVFANIATEAFSTATLTDNTPSPTLVTGFSIDASTPKSIFVKYALKRGTHYSTGNLLIITDGTDSKITQYASSIGPLSGIDFTSAINGTNLELRYISTDTGSNATFKFNISETSI